MEINIPQNDNPTLTPAESALLETFRQTYSVASSVKEADEVLTTIQVYGMLKDSQGGKLSFDAGYLDEWLFKQGFTYEFLDIQKFWLLKKA